ncbi:MAG: hypothetical protein JST11_26205 [Acidobacteria bacterium]|nr:hypothetical protein [Acidobacteriota bacterium]
MVRTALLLLLSCAAWGQKYDGPRPPKSDLPYLKHADNLIPTEAGEAKEEKGKKDDITYVIAGASSTAKTPLASPIFLFQSAKLSPETLQLFKLESRNGRRELTVSPKKPGKPIRMDVTRLTADGLYKLEVEDSLDPGEYSLSPTESNQVFCFQVF